MWELAVVWLVMWIAGAFIIFSYDKLKPDRIVKEYSLLMTVETWVPFLQTCIYRAAILVRSDASLHTCIPGILLLKLVRVPSKTQ